MSNSTELLAALKQIQENRPASIETFDDYFDVIDAMRADKSFKKHEEEIIGKIINNNRSPQGPFSECLTIQNKLDAAITKCNPSDIYPLLNKMIVDESLPQDMIYNAMRLWPSVFDACVQAAPKQTRKAALSVLSFRYNQVEEAPAFVINVLTRVLPVLSKYTEKNKDEGIALAQDLFLYTNHNTPQEIKDVLAQHILRLTNDGPESNPSINFLVLCKAAILAAENPVLLQETLDRCEAILNHRGKNDLVSTFISALESASNIFLYKQRNAFLPATLGFVNKHVPDLIGIDNKLALRGSSAAVRLASDCPRLQDESLTVWKETLHALLATDPFAVADVLTDQAFHENADRKAVKESWLYWKQATQEVFDRDQALGTGMALDGVISAELMARFMLFHSHGNNSSLNNERAKSLPEQAHLAQINAFKHFAADLCRKLCDTYKLHHPASALYSMISNFEYPDGADPLRRFPSINLVKGIGNSKIALTCFIQWQRKKSKRPEEKSACTTDILIL